MEKSCPNLSQSLPPLQSSRISCSKSRSKRNNRSSKLNSHHSHSSSHSQNSNLVHSHPITSLLSPSNSSHSLSHSKDISLLLSPSSQCTNLLPQLTRPLPCHEPHPALNLKCSPQLLKFLLKYLQHLNDPHLMSQLCPLCPVSIHAGLRLGSEISVRWSVNAVQVSKKPMTFATHSASQDSWVSMNFAGATVPKISKAMELFAKSPSQWAEAGALRLCARAAKSGAFCGIPSVLRATTQKAAVFAPLIVPQEWETMANNVKKRATQGKTLILWSAQKVKNRKVSCVTTLVDPDKKDPTMFVGVNALQVLNSAAFSVLNTEKLALPISPASARILSHQSLHSKKAWVQAKDKCQTICWPIFRKKLTTTKCCTLHLSKKCSRWDLDFRTHFALHLVDR